MLREGGSQQQKSKKKLKSSKKDGDWVQEETCLRKEF